MRRDNHKMHYPVTSAAAFCGPETNHDSRLQSRGGNRTSLQLSGVTWGLSTLGCQPEAGVIGGLTIVGPGAAVRKGGREAFFQPCQNILSPSSPKSFLLSDSIINNLLPFLPPVYGFRWGF